MHLKLARVKALKDGMKYLLFLLEFLWNQQTNNDLKAANQQKRKQDLRLEKRHLVSCISSKIRLNGNDVSKLFQTSSLVSTTVSFFALFVFCTARNYATFGRKRRVRSWTIAIKQDSNERSRFDCKTSDCQVPLVNKSVESFALVSCRWNVFVEIWCHWRSAASIPPNMTNRISSIDWEILMRSEQKNCVISHRTDKDIINVHAAMDVIATIAWNCNKNQLISSMLVFPQNIFLFALSASITQCLMDEQITK